MGDLAGPRAAPGRWLGAPPDDPSLKERKLGWMHDIGLHLMGRNTYEEMAGFWPTSSDSYAAPMNEIPKVVFLAPSSVRIGQTRGSRAARWPTRSRRSSASHERPPAWGGATFAQSLSRLGLVDEYRLILEPIALGEGLPLFKDLTVPLRLALVDAQTYATGAALHVYRPVRD